MHIIQQCTVLHTHARAVGEPPKAMESNTPPNRMVFEPRRGGGDVQLNLSYIIGIYLPAETLTKRL